MPGNKFKKSQKGFTQTPLFKRFKNGAGFTLLELIVVLALFSLLSVIIIDVYLLALRAQRQTSQRQIALGNVRYVMESIARDVRVSEIDYDYDYNDDGDSGIDGSETELALYNQAGESIVYKWDYIYGRLEKVMEGQNYFLTNASEIEIINLDFYISPGIDPFKEERCNDGLIPNGCQVAVPCTVNNSSGLKSGFCQCLTDDDCATGFCDPEESFCLPPNQQPRVTIAIGFKSKGPRIEEEKTIFLQTTVSSRIYKR